LRYFLTGSLDGRPSSFRSGRRGLGLLFSIAAHAALFGGLAVMRQEMDEIISPLDSLSIDLAPEGDTMESEEAPEMEISEAQPEQVQQPDLVIPPPQVMTPQAPPLPIKKAERKENTLRSDRRQQASVRHRLGVAGGRASTMSRASYMGLLAAAIARHVPSVVSLGPGTALCYFSVTSGGSIAGVSCSGTTPSHAALLRSAIYATRPPGPPPGGGFSTSQPVRFHEM